MPEQLTEFMRGQLSAAWSDEAFLEGAEQIASKSLLKELSDDEDLRERTWTFAEPLVHRTAAVLSYLASTLSIEAEEGQGEPGGRGALRGAGSGTGRTGIGPGQEPGGRGALQGHALRLARLWEGLARLGEETPRGYALLNAACAYELAGYQANAACLSRRFGEHQADEKGPFGGWPARSCSAGSSGWAKSAPPWPASPTITGPATCRTRWASPRPPRRSRPWAPSS